MSRAKPYPSDPSLRESRVADAPALPVTGPAQAPPGDPGANSPRAREEGLGVKPAVVEENLVALAELDAAAKSAEEEGGTGGSDTPARPAKTAPAAMPTTARSSEKAKPPTSPAKKAPAKKAAATKKAAKK